MQPVSKTAYYCCGVRMQDAERKEPLVNDRYARRLMGEDGLVYWEEFKGFHKPNSSNIARCYLIDNFVRDALLADEKTNVFLIGAGLDSRAFRFAGGNWIEVDESAIIEYKNNVLPTSECKNPLTRIAIDFETDTLEEKLAAYAGNEPALVIVEGVILYLSNEQLATLLDTLQKLFPKHVLLCDLLKRNFFNLTSRRIHRKLVASGTTFQDLDNNPTRLFLEKGYEQTDIISTTKTAVNVGKLRVPKFVVNTLMGNYFMGYAVYRFRYGF